MARAWKASRICSTTFRIFGLNINSATAAFPFPIGARSDIRKIHSSSESFVDELAAAGGKDPVELRRRMLDRSPRLLAVLEMVAAKSDWGKPMPAGHARGVAVVNNIGSFTAQVAEVSVDRGKVRVHRVVCAVDCGPVVNPALVEQQIQGGIVYGLSAALKGGITIKNGRVQQGNFNDYDVLRIDEMPAVEVHIVRNR